MKKIFLSVAVLFCVSFSNAQTFGVKVGGNYSSLSGVTNSEGKAGFTVGFFKNYEINEELSVQPELLFSTQGGAGKQVVIYDGATPIFVDYTSKYSLSYINIPIMAKYKIAEKFSAEAGPQIGILVSNNTEYTATGVTKPAVTVPTELKSFKSSDLFTTIDFGVNFGLGYDIAENIGVNVRYNIGLLDIYKDGGVNNIQAMKDYIAEVYDGDTSMVSEVATVFKNRVLSLSFTYAF